MSRYQPDLQANFMSTTSTIELCAMTEINEWHFTSDSPSFLRMLTIRMASEAGAPKASGAVGYTGTISGSSSQFSAAMSSCATMSACGRTAHATSHSQQLSLYFCICTHQFRDVNLFGSAKIKQVYLKIGCTEEVSEFLRYWVGNCL